MTAKKDSSLTAPRRNPPVRSDTSESEVTSSTPAWVSADSSELIPLAQQAMADVKTRFQVFCGCVARLASEGMTHAEIAKQVRESLSLVSKAAKIGKDAALMGAPATSWPRDKNTVYELTLLGDSEAKEALVRPETTHKQVEQVKVQAKPRAPSQPVYAPTPTPKAKTPAFTAPDTAPAALAKLREQIAVTKSLLHILEGLEGDIEDVCDGVAPVVLGLLVESMDIEEAESVVEALGIYPEVIDLAHVLEEGDANTPFGTSTDKLRAAIKAGWLQDPDNLLGRAEKKRK